MTIIYSYGIIYTHMYIHISEPSLFTSMYRLIIEYSFMFMNDSFNNRAEPYQAEPKRAHG
jgi:hypothetical protein